MPATAVMRAALEEAFIRGRLDRAMPVSFRFESGNRVNVVRDLVLSIAFEDTRKAAKAAESMAGRLAEALDLRSKPGLLMTSVTQVAGQADRSLIMWLFPQEGVFRLAPKTAEVEVVDDAFSRASYFRKAAVFTGKNHRSGFLSGRVLDNQANATDRFVSDLWIGKFLDTGLQVSSSEGTEILARTLRAANAALAGDPAGRQQLHAGMAALRHAPQPRVSIEAFCDRYLPDGSARHQVLASAPNADATSALFDFDLERFDALVQFHIFELSTGVTVSAPFAEIGDSVHVEQDGDARLLTARGQVVDERLRARRG